MCDCAIKVDVLLAERNLRLVFATLITEDLNLTSKLCVVTEKINTEVKENPGPLTITFCPFCGEKQ